MDRLWMENYLLVLKSTIEVYIHGTLESSNDDIRLILKKGLDETLNAQSKTYQLMTQNNWYKIYNVDNSIINKTLEQINNSNN